MDNFGYKYSDDEDDLSDTNEINPDPLSEMDSIISNPS